MSYIEFKNINFNHLLEREKIVQDIKNLLISFEENKNKVIKIKKSNSDVDYFNSLINKTF